MSARYAVLLLAGLSIAGTADAAAPIQLFNGDDPGKGFNDPTPVAPVGGNIGTTLGVQRQRVFLRAADMWGAELDSVPAIRILAYWPELPCTANTATLGAAGPTQIFAFSPGTVPGYWYPSALANKLAGDWLNPAGLDIVSLFNPRIGEEDCLAGIHFYLGLDGNAPPGTVDLLQTVLHEFAHGLGFLSTTDGGNGEFCCGAGVSFPSIYDRFLLDKRQGLHWDVMNDAQRTASAINGVGALVWDGPIVVADVPSVLGPAAEVQVTAPAGAAAVYRAGSASFGPSLETPLSGELMPVAAEGLACDPLTRLDIAAVRGKVALINRGGCSFVAKMLNLQAAGAIGAVVVDNQQSAPPSDMAGTDPLITIPAAMISRADGDALLPVLQFRSRTNSGVLVRLGQSATFKAGADEQNRPLIYAPSVFNGGSSISHWDVSAFPNLLMEPFDTADNDHSLKPPGDLTLPLLQQLGW